MNPTDIVRGLNGLITTLDQQAKEIAALRVVNNALDVKVAELESTIRQLKEKK